MNTLDKLDIKILQHLQHDASLSNARLSELVNLSPSQSHRRVKRLEQEGYIDQYVALLNHKKLGITVHAIVIIKIKKVDPESKKSFKALIESYDMITECWAVSGEKDVLLKIVAPSLDDYSDFVSEKVFSIPGVISAESYLLLDKMKCTSKIPIPNKT